jgi:hypothetical protein
MQGRWVGMLGHHFVRDAGRLERELLERVAVTHLGRIRCLAWGEMLHWQGDPGGVKTACSLRSELEVTASNHGR